MTGLLCAEDLPVGVLIDLGSVHVTQADIMEFAELWDPQPFHVDAEAAARGRFGEVIASGLHTMCLFQRLAVLTAYRHWAIVAGRSILDVQLPLPLRPNSTVAGQLLVEHVELTEPDRALVLKRGTVTHGGELLLEMRFEASVRRRPAASDPPQPGTALASPARPPRP